MKISLLFLVVFSFLDKAWALNVKPTSRTINEKAFQVAIKSSFFKTTGIIDDLGAAYSLAGGESFSKNDYALFLKYGFSRDLEIFGDVIFRNISTAQKNIKGVESLSLGTKYQMRTLGSWGFGWETYYRKTLYSNSPSLNPTQELTLGDHGQEVAVHFITSFKPFSRMYFSLLAGYKRPPNELSSEIPYLFESVFTGQTWNISLGVEGNFSLKKNKPSDTHIDVWVRYTMQYGARVVYGHLHAELTELAKRCEKDSKPSTKLCECHQMIEKLSDTLDVNDDDVSTFIPMYRDAPTMAANISCIPTEGDSYITAYPLVC
jgi:hypothetical protein